MPDPLKMSLLDGLALEPVPTPERFNGHQPRDFWSSVAVLRRRWPIALAGLGLTLAAAAILFSAISPTYRAEGKVILLPPAEAPPIDLRALVPPEEGAAAGEETDDRPVEEEEPVTSTTFGTEENPYLGFGGTLNIMGEVLATVLNSDQTRTEVAAGATADYEVELEAGDAPILSISASGEDAESAMATQAAATEALVRELDQRQGDAGAPGPTRITARELSTPVDATLERTSKIRAAVGVLVLGVAGTVLLVFLVEGWSERRRPKVVSR